MANNTDTIKIAEAELTRKRRADVIQRLESLNSAVANSLAPPNDDEKTILNTVKIVFDIRELLREYRKKSEQHKIFDLSSGITQPLGTLEGILDRNPRLSKIKDLVKALGQELTDTCAGNHIRPCEMTKDVAEVVLSAALTLTSENPTEHKNLENMQQQISADKFSSSESEDVISKFIKNILQLVERVCRSSTYCKAMHTVSNFYEKPQTEETQPSSDGSTAKVSM